MRRARRGGAWAGMMGALLALALGAAALPPAFANDSEAAIGIGGIELRPSDALVMESEDLYISEDRVRVTYRYTNPTDAPVTVTVAFPLPSQPRGLGEAGYWIEQKREWDDIGFRTTIDGRPAELTRVDRAMIGEKDVTERIAKLGFPLWWFESEQTTALFERMSDADRLRYLEEGLAARDESYDGRVLPAWDVATFFVRSQSFAPRASVVVEHSYSPVNGGSVGGMLEQDLREDFPEGLAAYRRDYCVDDHFLTGVDRRLAELRETGRQAFTGEVWIGYVLSTGANWRGPIRDFRLVVDKGSTDNLVSFCMDGVKKIGPTRFGVRKTDFEPAGDLKILIAKFHSLDP